MKELSMEKNVFSVKQDLCGSLKHKLDEAAISCVNVTYYYTKKEENKKKKKKREVELLTHSIALFF